MAISDSYIGKTTKDFQVGQVVWFVTSGRYVGNRRGPGDKHSARVTKVGRKWVYFRPINYKYQDDERFDPTDPNHRGIGWSADAGDWHSPGTVYLEEQHLIDVRDTGIYQKKLEDAFRSYGGNSFTLEQLREAVRVLGL